MTCIGVGIDAFIAAKRGIGFGAGFSANPVLTRGTAIGWYWTFITHCRPITSYTGHNPQSAAAGTFGVTILTIAVTIIIFVA